MSWFKKSISSAVLAVALACCCFSNSTVFATEEQVAQLASGHISDYWAESFVKKAQQNLILHEDFPLDLRENMTREDFATLLILIYEKFFNVVVLVPHHVPFTDTEHINVKKAYSLGLVSGRSVDIFDPEGFITREEAAVMVEGLMEKMYQHTMTVGVQSSVHDLLNSPMVPDALKVYMVQVLYYIEMAPDSPEYAEFLQPENAAYFFPILYTMMINSNTHTYKDQGDISFWASDAVNFNYIFELMLGDDRGNFNPQQFIDVQSCLVLGLQMRGVS